MCGIQILYPSLTQEFTTLVHVVALLPFLKKDLHQGSQNDLRFKNRANPGLFYLYFRSFHIQYK